MKFQILTNGNLEITRTRKDRPELKELLDKEPNDDVAFLAELLEHTRWQPNGYLYQVKPEDVGGLTDSPILADDVTHEDDGTVIVHGNVWWYPNYMVMNFADELYKTGRTVFTRAEPVVESATVEAVSV